MTDTDTDTDTTPLHDPMAGEPSEGMSPLAIPADTQWDDVDRPRDWQGHVYGLVVHTTGSGLPSKARAQGVYHTVAAVNHYSKSHGCHYVNGWLGVGGGDLLQVANEREQAIGVGMTNPAEPEKDQRRSVESGRFEEDLPAVLVRHWRERWPGRADPLALLPGTKTANSCYVHVECVPCVFHTDDGLVTGEDVEPMRPGLRFTQAQHDTVAELAVDVARRNAWPADEEWWRTPRLLGHEDLTPIARCDRNGGWDPGALRDEPYFDWEYVYERIGSILCDGPGGSSSDHDASDAIQPSVFDVLGERAQSFIDLVLTGEEQAAVVEAHGAGVTDENELTDLVFFVHHPEMNGRKIKAHETALADEWRDVRDVVRTALDGLSGG